MVSQEQTGETFSLWHVIGKTSIRRGYKKGRIIVGNKMIPGVEGDLCEYVREYVAGKYDELELSGYNLEVDIPEQRMYGTFDRMQLKRAFENIIANAVKYTEPGTVIRISITCESESPDKAKSSSAIKDKKWMRIELGDNGPGIPQQYRDTIFEPFVVGDESRTSGKGTGLGLSIARQTVRLHGGKITLLDRPGTVFCIKLPLL